MKMENKKPNKQNTMKPFELSYTHEFSRILNSLNSSLAISTYQAGKVILLSSQSPKELIQLPRSFSSPMGLALDKNRFAIATKTNITTFGKMNKQVLQQKQDKYDACFIPTASFYTGFAHLHDISFGEDKLYAVNTNFSTIGTVNIDYNFTPYWKPQFIDEVTGEDQCHLNGMAMQNDRPRYVTAFSKTSEAKGWRKTDLKNGILIDIESNEIVSDNIHIPHSPRFHNNKVYFLESATSKLKVYNPKTNKTTEIVQLHGFVRGLDFIGDYAFIGISKIRPSSKLFGNLEVATKDYNAGVVVVHMPSKKIVAKIEYLSSVNEIYDIKLLPNIKRPNIIGMDNEQFNVISMPNSGYWLD